MANNETLSPKVDVVFQALFGEPGSERITKQFLESILEEKIESIDLSKNTILRREYKTDKLGVLDVIAKINGKENKKLILTDKLEIVIIELKKIKGKERVEGQLLDWLFFLDSPNSERVKEKMKENKALREASEKLQTMSEEDYMERIAWLREKAILDYNSGMSSARRKGMQEGERKGRKEGRKEKGLEIAKKLLKQGVEISIITNATDLSKEEIMSIQ